MTDFSDRIDRLREKWRYTGRERPDFALVPGPGQESVWDYPRPPRLQQDSRIIEVIIEDAIIAKTRAAYRILETASPPTVYLPPQDVRLELLEPAAGGSVCEWKGKARYFSIRLRGRLLRHAAWCYPEPFPEFEAIADYVSFYPSMLGCYVDGERAGPQPGGFYGGWVTADVIGPFKGEPGTEWW